MNKKIILLSFAIEIILLLFLGFKAFKPNDLINVPYDSWSENAKTPYSITSPYFLVNYGSYMISIKYTAQEDGLVTISSDAENSYNLSASETTLHSQKHVEKIQFEASGKVDNTYITIASNSSIDIDYLEVFHTHNPEKRTFIVVLFMFVCLNILLINRTWISKNKLTIGFILAITFIASLPIFTYGTEVGHDLDFHLMRIEGISQELIALHLPVRVQSFYNYGYGYPVSIYYGDLLLYFPALLHIVGFSLVQAYKIYSFTINLITTILCFYAGIKIWKNNSTALFFSAAFTLSTYRFVDIYVRNAVGEYTAIMFFPLIVLGIYELYYASNYNTGIINKKALFYITIGMTGIITSHILTTEMVCIFLFVFALINIKKTLSKTTITTGALSILSTALLSAYFIVPFADYYFHVSVNINNTNNATAHIQSDGAYILQYFAFFKSLFGARSELLSERLSATPGLLLISVLCLSIFLILKDKATDLQKKLTIGTIVIMFISSNLFPWDMISKTNVGNFLAQIQFPWRWLIFACILLAILFGTLINDVHLTTINNTNKSILSIVAIFIIILQVSIDIGSYANDAINIKAPKYSTDLNGTDYREYFLADSDFFSLTFDIDGDNLESGYLVKQNGTDYEYRISTNSEGYITLPILNYKGFHVSDESGNVYKIKDGAQQEISIKLPSHFNGTIYVNFIEPISWRIAEIVSVITLIVIIIYYSRQKII